MKYKVKMELCLYDLVMMFPVCSSETVDLEVTVPAWAVGDEELLNLQLEMNGKQRYLIAARQHAKNDPTSVLKDMKFHVAGKLLSFEPMFT